MKLKSLITVLESLKDEYEDMDVEIKEDVRPSCSTYGVKIDFASETVFILTHEPVKQY